MSAHSRAQTLALATFHLPLATCHFPLATCHLTLEAKSLALFESPKTVSSHQIQSLWRPRVGGIWLSCSHMFGGGGSLHVAAMQSFHYTHPQPCGCAAHFM